MKRAQPFSSWLLFASVALPLPVKESSPQWKIYRYDDLPPNHFEFGPQGLRVGVDKSVSPLVYVFPQRTTVKGFRLEADFRGLPIRADSKRDDYDDKALRVGVIVPGRLKPTFLERMIMPKWTNDLIQSVSAEGLEKIYYFSLATANTKNLSRVVYSRFHEEKVVDVLAAPGPYDKTIDFGRSFEAAAVWLSIDGDDTKSSYEVLIKRLDLLR